MICSVKIEKAFYNNKQVLEEIEFELEEGGILAIVGESGAGKTTLGRIISGLHRFFHLDYQGKVNLQSTVDVIPQNLTDSLDPVFTIRKQMLEVEKDESRIKETLKIVGFKDPDEILKAYPHNLSGGMRQRVLIAISLLRAQILLADEFTSALDSITKIRVVNLLKRLNKEKNISIIFITHDMELLEFRGDMIVMFDGKIIEKGKIESLKTKPQHPYTMFLMGATPKLNMHYKNERFKEVAINRKYACPFFESCDKARSICETQKPPLKKWGERWVRCHF